ncbi:TnpV protein [Oscillibacter sp.]|uniref:TnpV protein n=1 Tax=Oscillibacter sp. TaxID=1945593 RepID=UPI0026018C79|nr:TnpV protein [Oscillibacter sp.]MDD3346454.1 TnpV protein [Oscillibacter sp.]
MESSFEQNGIRYILVGDYYYPDLLPDPGEDAKQRDLIVQQMAKALGVNEELKEQDPMQWVGLMNNLRSAAREFLNE